MQVRRVGLRAGAAVAAVAVAVGVVATTRGEQTTAPEVYADRYSETSTSGFRILPLPDRWASSGAVADLLTVLLERVRALVGA